MCSVEALNPLLIDLSQGCPCGGHLTNKGRASGRSREKKGLGSLVFWISHVPYTSIQIRRPSLVISSVWYASVYVCQMKTFNVFQQQLEEEAAKPVEPEKPVSPPPVEHKHRSIVQIIYDENRVRDITQHLLIGFLNSVLVSPSPPLCAPLNGTSSIGP